MMKEIFTSKRMAIILLIASFVSLVLMACVDDLMLGVLAICQLIIGVSFAAELRHCIIMEELNEIRKIQTTKRRR
jgi:hypothetical protein